MFKVILGSLIAMSLIGCAGGSGSPSAPTPSPQPTTISCGELAGHYSNDIYAGQTMDISNTCQLTDSICGYQSSFTPPEIATGATIFTVANTNGTPGCMSNTAHSCLIEVRGNQLGISCDNGSHIYLFTR